MFCIHSRKKLKVFIEIQLISTTLHFSLGGVTMYLGTTAEIFCGITWPHSSIKAAERYFESNEIGKNIRRDIVFEVEKGFDDIP